MVAEIARPLLIKECWDELDDDDVARVADIERNVGHNRDKHVLLTREFAGVHERGCPVTPVFTKWVGKQLGHDLIDVDRRLTQREQLIDQSAEAGEEDTNCPGADSIASLSRVVGVGDDSTDFNVRRVVNDKSSL